MLSRAKFKCQFIIENELHSNFNFTICMRVFDGIIFAASGFFFFFFEFIALNICFAIYLGFLC